MEKLDKYGNSQMLFEIAYEDFCFEWSCNHATDDYAPEIEITGDPEISENGEWCIDCEFPDGDRATLYMNRDGNIYVEA